MRRITIAGGGLAGLTLGILLRQRGVPVEVHRYAGERHGFRQAGNLAHALEAEWSFYQALLAY